MCNGTSGAFKCRHLYSAAFVAYAALYAYDIPVRGWMKKQWVLLNFVIAPLHVHPEVGGYFCGIPELHSHVGCN
jgi:hypothetical protein